jgi:hypothetical protein
LRRNRKKERAARAAPFFDENAQLVLRAPFWKIKT